VKTATVLQHLAFEDLGLLAPTLEARGYRIDCHEVGRDGLTGLDPAQADLMVVLGGPVGTYETDDYPWLVTERALIARRLASKRPLLGICLGAQMLVNHLGGKVEGHPDGLVEIGWYPLKPTREGRELMDWPEMIYQFHREGFSLPCGAVRLAEGETYENQAFRYGDNAWGVQFHAELTQMMMQRWVTRGAHRFTLPGSQVGREHLWGRFLYDRPVLDWLRQFLDMVFVETPARAQSVLDRKAS